MGLCGPQLHPPAVKSARQHSPGKVGGGPKAAREGVPRLRDIREEVSEATCRHGPVTSPVEESSNIHNFDTGAQEGTPSPLPAASAGFPLSA